MSIKRRCPTLGKEIVFKDRSVSDGKKTLTMLDRVQYGCVLVDRRIGPLVGLPQRMANLIHDEIPSLGSQDWQG